jgi:hypothetical protein
VIEPAEFTAKLAALVEPNFTDVAPSKLLPAMLTDVPPLVGPLAGLRPVTVGTGGGGGGGASPPDEVEEVTAAVLADAAELEPVELEAVTTTFIR